MSRRRLFGSMLGMVFLVNLARVIFAPLLEPLMATFPIEEGTAGLVATLAWLGSAAPRVPVGYLLTRVSRHRVVLGSGVVLAAAAAGTALAPTIEFVALGAFLMGLSSGSYFIAAQPLVSELFPDRVGRMIGVHGTAAQIGAVIAGPFVGAALLFGGYRIVFWTMAAASLLVAIAIALFARRADLPDAGAEDRDLFGAIREQWLLILAGVAVVGTLNFAWNGTFNFYVSYLRSAGFAESAARDLLTVAFAAGVPAFWFSGWLADRVPILPLLSAIVGVFAASLFALTAVGSYLALALVSALLGYAAHSLYPVMDTFLLESFPDDNRASAYSAYSGAMMVVGATGSSVVGTLVEAGSTYVVVFRGFAGLAVLVLLGILLRWTATRR